MTVVSVDVRAPESSAASAVRDRVHAAIGHGARCRIVGAGTWLDAGRPVEADERIDLRAHSGIVEYVPGDLTLTALAGTSLAELERLTAAQDQWLPLDPFGRGESTLGATVATASAGPLAHGFGAARDNVLGVEAVTGRGEIVRAGGRVVKNVAGFDLTRLLIGSWGTLGVITEVSLRLRARPDVDRTVAARVPDDPAALDTVLAALRRAPLAALAMQLVNATLARTLGLDENPLLLVRLGGNEEAVRAQLAILEQAVGRDAGAGSPVCLEEVPADVWRRLRECEPRDAIVLRLAGSPTMLAVLWTGALDAARVADGALVHAWCGSGTVRLIVPGSTVESDSSALGTMVRELPEGRRIGERLPSELWPRLSPTAVMDPLSVRVRDAFDPRRLLNPGILGEVTA